jgi:hypothetical protein
MSVDDINCKEELNFDPSAKWCPQKENTSGLTMKLAVPSCFEWSGCFATGENLVGIFSCDHIQVQRCNTILAFWLQLLMIWQCSMVGQVEFKVRVRDLVILFFCHSQKNCIGELWYAGEWVIYFFVSRLEYKKEQRSF